MFEGCYRLNEPEVVSDEFDGETVILDLSNGVYCSFSGSGDRIWGLLAAAVPPQEVLAALEKAGNPWRADVERFIGELIGSGLLRRDDALTPAALTSLPEITEAPVLERFDDLAELIMSDPIHESDTERGWPALRSDGAAAQ